MNQQKAILLVSFGTSYEESRKKTIDKILEDVTNAFPDYQIYQAWTSKMIIHILEQRDHIHIPTIEEAMMQIQSDGITDLTVQPTHLINGLENDMMKETILSMASSDIKVRFGNPLLTSTEDNHQVLEAVMPEFSDIPSKEALVFMGHGTTHYVNSVYAALDYTLKDMGYHHVFMGTVEAYPDLDVLIRQVSRTNPCRVHLAPFMLVAGDHANNDMAGNENDSWKSRFEAAGYEVVCHLKGLGEYESIRNIYLEHLQDAISSELKVTTINRLFE